MHDPPFILWMRMVPQAGLEPAQRCRSAACVIAWQHCGLPPCSLAPSAQERVARSSRVSGTVLGMPSCSAERPQRCSPHSVFPVPLHRPDRGCAPRLTGVVVGAHPIDVYPASVNGCRSSPI